MAKGCDKDHKGPAFNYTGPVVCSSKRRPRCITHWHSVSVIPLPSSATQIAIRSSCPSRSKRAEMTILCCAHLKAFSIANK